MDGSNQIPVGAPSVPPAWVSFWAGSIGGALGVVAGQPLDVIKTRQQALNYKSAWQCVVQTMKGEGFFALYKGMVPPVLATAAVNAVLFFYL